MCNMVSIYCYSLKILNVIHYYGQMLSSLISESIH